MKWRIAFGDARSAEPKKSGHKNVLETFEDSFGVLNRNDTPTLVQKLFFQSEESFRPKQTTFYLVTG